MIKQILSSPKFCTWTIKIFTVGLFAMLAAAYVCQQIPFAATSFDTCVIELLK